MSDLILAMSSTECRYAPNYSTDAFVAYATNSCSATLYGSAPDEYLKEVSFATPCVSSFCPEAQKYMLSAKGYNRLYSKPNTDSLTLYSYTTANQPISQMTVQLSSITKLNPSTLEAIVFTRSDAKLNADADLLLEITPKIQLMKEATVYVTVPKNE